MLALLVVFQVAVGAIKGGVIDTTSHPVRGITVEVLGASLSAVTDSAGNFRINHVPVGSRVIHIGHVAKQVDVKADTAAEVILMTRDVAPPHLVWLGCKPFGSCSQMRYVATFRRTDIPGGVGVIRDAGVWKAFLARHAQGDNAAILNDIIDWPHEMLVIVCDAGINRVDRTADRLTVLLGPDSISGTPPAAGATIATVIAVKRTTLPVDYQAILPTTHVPPTVDWSAQ